MNPIPFELRDPLLDTYHADGALEPGEIKARRPHRTRGSKPFVGVPSGLHR